MFAQALDGLLWCSYFQMRTIVMYHSMTLSVYKYFCVDSQTNVQSSSRARLFYCTTSVKMSTGVMDYVTLLFLYGLLTLLTNTTVHGNYDVNLEDDCKLSWK